MKARIMNLRKEAQEFLGIIKCTKEKIAVIDKENLVLENAYMSHEN